MTAVGDVPPRLGRALGRLVHPVLLARPEVDAVGAGVGAPHAQRVEHVRERELVSQCS